MNTCKTCKYWNRKVHNDDHRYFHLCDNGDKYPHPLTNEWIIDWGAPGNQGKLFTGKDFGCVNHESI